MTCEGVMSVKTRCPMVKCTQRVPEELFRVLLAHEIFEKYREFTVKNFIETSKFMHLCPAPGCEKVAVGSGITNVECSCGNPFCFRCGEQAHDPATCAQLMMWLAKCKDES